jgi:hypothetical protein
MISHQTWTANGKRVQVWVWPESHPLERDIDVSDLVPVAAIVEDLVRADTAVEDSDLHAIEFSLDKDVEAALDPRVSRVAQSHGANSSAPGQHHGKGK